MSAILGILGIFNSPLGRIAVLAMAFFAWTAYQRDQAADRARQECQAEQLQKTLAEVDRQRVAAVAARKTAEEQQGKTKAELADLEKENARITKELGKSPPATCSVPQRTLDRLRNIR